MKFTEYTLKQRRGYDDLYQIYAFSGASQGDETRSNDIKDYNEWMIYNFKNIPLDQDAINKESNRRKKLNDEYISKLKNENRYGELFETTISIEQDETYDKNTKVNNTCESYRFDIFNIGKHDI